MSSALQIQFLGIEEGSDPKNLPPGTLLRANNCAMDKTRRLCKRRGTVGLAKTALSGSNIAAGQRLLTCGDDTALTDGTTAWTYAESVAKWNPIDRPPCWRATKRGLIDSVRSVSAVDIAASGDVLVTASVGGTGSSVVCVQINSLSTGRMLMAPFMLSLTGSNPRVLINGTTAIVLFSLATNTIRYQIVDLTTLAIGASGNLVTDARTTTAPVFDAVLGTPTAGVPTLYVAYELDLGVNRTKIASFTASTLASIASATYLGTAMVSVGLAFADLSQRVLLIFSSTTSANTYLVTTDTALAPIAGPTSILATAVVPQSVFIVEDDATNTLVGYTRNVTSTGAAEVFVTALYSVAAHAVVATSVRTTYALLYSSKPWRTAGRWYCEVGVYAHLGTATSGNLAPAASSIVVEIETAASLTSVQDMPHVHVATLENQTGWSSSSIGYVTKPTVDSNGDVYLVAAYRNREPGQWYMEVPVGWSLYRLAVSEGDTSRPTALGAAALCAGAAPYWFDGASTMPYGFIHAPCILSVTDTGAGSMAAGIYSYVVTYAWRDAGGLLHRSAPSPPKAGTAGANRALTVRVATTSIAARQKTQTSVSCPNPVLIELWRTIVGGTGSHYRLSLEPLYQILINDPQVGFVDVVDTKADANIGAGANGARLDAQAQLYTDLGELANVPPPSLLTVATHRGRLVGIGPDLRTVWFSKDSTQDATQAPGFNEALTLAFAKDKTALASLDTTLAVFGEDDIDVIQGDGPDDAGGNNTWQIQAVQTDVGCINPRSPVTFPGGVIFESRVGLSLLDRNLNVTWIGRSIDDTLASYPNITSGVLVAEQTEVRWTCDDGETGIVLAYDYLERVWFVRKYTDASDTLAASIRFADAALIDGVYTLLTTAGQVYRETSAHYLDGATTYVERDVLLAPISAQPGKTGWSNDNLGWSRVKDLTLMGTSVSDHDLEISFAHDYGTTFTQTHTFLAGSDVCTPGPLEKSRVTCARQKCQAVQIRIRDLTPTAYAAGSSGAGPILESLSLRVAALDGNAKTGARQRG